MKIDDEILSIVNDYIDDKIVLDSELCKEIKALFKHGVCKDCAFNQISERPSVYANCINEYMGELVTESDHSLIYPYDEGAMLETSPNFGCVNFEKRTENEH